jgi:protein arginine kinase activator
MLCRRCKKNEADFIVKAAVHKRLTSLALCRRCLSLKEKELGLERGTLLYYAAPLRGSDYARSAPVSRRDLRLKCPACGLLYAQFRETGSLGCPSCYDAFRVQLDNFFTRLSGASRHAGRVYRKSAAVAEFSLDADSLQNAIKSAVRHEDYERAAKLRDILNSTDKRHRGKQS